MKRSILQFGMGVFWLIAVGFGLGLLWRDATTAGEAAQAPSEWPLTSRLNRADQRPTLLIFFHPHCPCSRATLGELEKLMAQTPGLVEVRAIFVKPHGVPLDWEQTDLWRRAARLPGMSLYRDEEAQEAHLFGAKTSGQVLLYDRFGKLALSGGITAGRGHAGENAGRTAIVSWLRAEPFTESSLPVYGCPLFAAQDACDTGDECLTSPPER